MIFAGEQSPVDEATEDTEESKPQAEHPTEHTTNPGKSNSTRLFFL